MQKKLKPTTAKKKSKKVKTGYPMCRTIVENTIWHAIVYMRSTSNAFILHLLHLTIEWFNTDVNYMRVTVMIPQKTEDTKADFPTVSKKKWGKWYQNT